MGKTSDKKSFGKLLAEAVDEMAPVIEKTFDDVVETISTAIEEVVEVMGDFVDDVSQGAAATTDEMLDIASEALNKDLGKLAKDHENIVEDFAKVTEAIFGSICEANILPPKKQPMKVVEVKVFIDEDTYVARTDEEGRPLTNRDHKLLLLDAEPLATRGSLGRFRRALKRQAERAERTPQEQLQIVYDRLNRFGGSATREIDKLTKQIEIAEQQSGQKALKKAESDTAKTAKLLKECRDVAKHIEGQLEGKSSKKKGGKK